MIMIIVRKEEAMKILARLGVCKGCGKIVNLKKEKQGKGQAPVYYCPKCGTTN
jgi:predicted RNA-binding Zn-ribbon protein involved in translation (DUF1610 family)